MGEGGEQNAPLGRAVIGGLLLATVATLVFVPAVFSLLHKHGAAVPPGSAMRLAPQPTRHEELDDVMLERPELEELEAEELAEPHVAPAPPPRPPAKRTAELRFWQRWASPPCSVSGSMSGFTAAPLPKPRWPPTPSRRRSRS